MRTILLYFFVPAWIAILGVFLSSCAPSLKGEKRQFERNIQKLKEYSVDFPRMAPILRDKEKALRSAFGRSRDVQGKKARAKAMDEVNDEFRSDRFIKLLDKYTRRRKKVNSLRRYVRRYKYKTKFRRPVKRVLKGTSRDLQKADRIINSEYINSMQTAVEHIHKAKDVIDHTYYQLKSLKRRIKESKKK